jgi:hypothetical protein
MAKAASFTKIDLKRAVEAVRAGGVQIGRIEIEQGRIIIVPDNGAKQSENALDQWMSKHAR